MNDFVSVAASVVVPRGGNAVMASKRPRLSEGTYWQDAELFPTPPWATRALMYECLPMLGEGLPGRSVWEPAAGLGHMSLVLAEGASYVLSCDLNDYGVGGIATGSDFMDFVFDQVDPFDWIITNPPFGLAQAFVKSALLRARVGVAMLMRWQFRETATRYPLFVDTPPTCVFEFSERVPMCEGGYDPDQATATAYAWFVWVKNSRGEWRRPFCRNVWKSGAALDVVLLPPVMKRTYFRESDRAMAAWCMPGFVPPSLLSKERRAGEEGDAMSDFQQAELEKRVAFLARCIEECAPDWFVMESVRDAPLLRPWCGRSAEIKAGFAARKAAGEAS